MLGDEFGTASNIKSRVNRQSVLGAITSAQQRLKLYNKVDGLLVMTCTCAFRQQCNSFLWDLTEQMSKLSVTLRFHQMGWSSILAQF